MDDNSDDDVVATFHSCWFDVWKKQIATSKAFRRQCNMNVDYQSVSSRTCVELHVRTSILHKTKEKSCLIEMQVISKWFSVVLDGVFCHRRQTIIATGTACLRTCVTDPWIVMVCALKCFLSIPNTYELSRIENTCRHPNFFNSVIRKHRYRTFTDTICMISLCGFPSSG